jgi:hypothetical protein
MSKCRPHLASFLVVLLQLSLLVVATAAPFVPCRGAESPEAADSAVEVPACHEMGEPAGPHETKSHDSGPMDCGCCDGTSCCCAGFAPVAVAPSAPQPTGVLERAQGVAGAPEVVAHSSYVALAPKRGPPLITVR